MKRNILILAVLSAAMGSINAQTTLTGDHIITGDLDVGTSGAKGSLEVTGETGGSAAPGIKVTGDGGVVFEGTFGTGQIPATGAGTRFMWYPEKAAIRAGSVDDTQWNDENIGDFSFAFGENTEAGYLSLAGGAYSTADYYGVAVGHDNHAYGGFSVALGSNSYAVGEFSTAIGNGTYALAKGCLVVGEWNSFSGAENSTQWVETDPIFVIGNGQELFDPLRIETSNAFVVYKNGNVDITGKVNMPRQGDILMGEFGNPE